MHQGRGLGFGTTVDRRWRIGRMLGQGGFGVTYEAIRIDTDGRVALKEYMPSGLCTRQSGSTEVIAEQGPAGDLFKRGMGSFLREAETLARLHHPSIVRISEYFEANGTAYMALDFVEGESLGYWLKRVGRQPTQDELDGILSPLFDALIQVHSLPLLHRDLKPDNIMLRPDGTPVLIDFGAVRSMISSGTRTVGAGTLAFVTDGYAPPEQYVPDGERLLGPWTDVYALGATCYEAVAGFPPPSAQFRQIEETCQPLLELVAQSDGIATSRRWRPEFLATVDRAMSLRRQDRPQSMVEFRTALGLNRPRRQADRSTSTPVTTSASSEPRAPAEFTAGRPIEFSEIKSPRSARTWQWKDVPRSMQIGASLAAFIVLLGGTWLMNRAKPTGSPPELPKVEQAAKSSPQPAQGVSRIDQALTVTAGSKQSFKDCETCPDMVVVPAGRYTMGSPATEPERFSIEDQVAVTISYPFAIGRFEVTFAEWALCRSEGSCDRDPHDQDWGRGNRPVINVSWQDAKQYVAWLSRKTGRTYRLPSEAEWEYAARAGTTTPFSLGHSITPAEANYDGSAAPYRGGGAKGENRRRTVAVESFQPNSWGLYQVHGNVREWTEDCWDRSNASNPANGSARTTGDCGSRTRRGGSWLDDPKSLRSADRLGAEAGSRDDRTGFRVARDLQQSGAR